MTTISALDLEYAENAKQDEIRKLMKGENVSILLSNEYIDGLDGHSYEYILNSIIKPDKIEELEKTTNDFATPNTLLWIRTHPLIRTNPEKYLIDFCKYHFHNIPRELFNENYYSITYTTEYYIETDVIVHYNKFFIDKKYSFCDAIAKYYNYQNS